MAAKETAEIAAMPEVSQEQNEARFTQSPEAQLPYRDPQVSAEAADTAQDTPMAVTAPLAPGDNRLADVTMQSTGLNAASSSIYSGARPTPGDAAQGTAGALGKTLYQGSFPTEAPPPPVAEIPVSQPQPAASRPSQTDILPLTDDEQSKAGPVAQPLELAAQAQAQANGARALPTVSTTGSKQAALAFNSLPGVAPVQLFGMTDTFDISPDEDVAPIEVAALPGLARLGRNGLWLQTEKVETGCFKPTLLAMLKTVENHYGAKIMVTSGLRGLKHNASASGRKQSLHVTCDAADIQVPGVGKWELAAFLRTLPERGGVGTYCHTESVHIDTGEARDWNWRCRRRKN